jgi:hypothetical protein
MLRPGAQRRFPPGHLDHEIDQQLWSLCADL